MEEETVRAVINSIVDPCSAGRGVPIGLVDMGLLRTVTVQRANGTVGVKVAMRVTSPGCSFTVEFDAQVRRRLRDAGADWVEIDWDCESFDWTPADIDPVAQVRLRHYRDVVRTATTRG
jgi:metal-sulfur cluster biosynthetic enzyme